jgi:PAS domain S-box-containing protein
MRWVLPPLTIRQVLVGQFLLVVLFATIMVAVLVVTWRLPIVHEQNQADQRRAAGIAAYHVDISLQYAEQLALSLASSFNQSARTPSSEQAVFRLLLTQLTGQADFFQGVYLLDQQGRIAELYVKTPDMPRVREWLGSDLSGLSVWRGVQQQNRPLWSDQYRSPVLDKPVVSFIAPLSEGYLLLELGVDRLAQAVRQSAVLEGLVVIVTDSKGEVVAAPDMSWVGLRRNISHWPLVQAALQAQPLHTPFEVDGQVYVGTSFRLERLDWVVVAGYPAAVVNASERAALGITSATVIVSVSFGLLLLWGFSQLIKQRLQRSLDYADRVARGQYEAPLVKTGVVELDALSHGLEQMAGNIRDRQTQLQAIIETTPSLAIQWFDRDGRVVDWNAASESVLGWTREEALGKTLDQLIYTPQQGAEFVEVLRRIEANGQPFGPYEGSILRRLEQPAWILSTTFCIPDLQGGKLFVCMDVDITELKRKEQAVRESEEKFNLFFQASPVAVAVLAEVEGGFHYLDVNPAWLTLLGYTREELVGYEATLNETILPKSVLQAVFTRLRETDELGGVLGKLRRKCGETLWVDVYMRLVRFQDQNLLICSMLNITDKRAMEKELRQLNSALEERIAQRTQKLSETIEHLQNAQAQLVQSEKLASLGSLVAGVAHELNTPIGNGMMSVSTLEFRLKAFRDKCANGLRKSDLDAFVSQVETATDIAMRNLRRASELVTSFKQVAVDQTSSQRRTFDLASVIQEVVLTLQPTFKHSPVQVRVDVPDGIEMNAYPGPLGQVITNLIQNALVHAFPDRDAGQVDITARLSADGWVDIRVQDDGVGIPVDKMDRIFDPFFTTRLGKGGSGLGLHIAHNIIHGVMGGQLTVHNRAAGGAVFQMRCPLQAPQSNGDMT